MEGSSGGPVVERGRNSSHRDFVMGHSQVPTKCRIVSYSVLCFDSGRGRAEMVDGFHQVSKREKPVRAAAEYGLHDGPIASAGLSVVKRGAVGHDGLNRVACVLQLHHSANLRHHDPNEVWDHV